MDVSGVGYEVLIPLSSYDRLPAVGQPLHILTHLHVREDAHILYGFMSPAERDLFRLLVNHVSGIGPKLALAVLSGMSVGNFKSAVVNNDVASLSKISGLGKKTAERIVLELKDKLGVSAVWEAASAAHAPTPEESQANEAVLALIALGYKQIDAHKTVRDLQEKQPEIKSAEELVKTALKRMAAGRRRERCKSWRALFSARMRPSFLLFSFALFPTFLATAMAEKPFDFAATPGKLPKQIVPQEYAIRITPDLKKFTFTGTETVKLDVRKPVREIVLNALEMEIASASVDDKAVAKSAIKLNAKEQTLTIALPAELQPGTHTLSLAFSGKINQQGQGLYRAPYQDAETGAKKVMLGTQFEATDARRMFPCWDEPIFRARFQLTAVIPENMIAVSNMPIESETKTAGGKEVRFAATPSMASYLNVLCVGELDAIEKKSGGVLHRVVATRGKAEMGHYALDSSAQVTEFYNDYFGTPYPLPKLDEIAVPGGFGGAMENWGGITYYESRLLYDPEESSAATKQGIYSVVAHEIAHQWFGNLVTMAWWDNLWLNEGFASWMGSKCTAKFNPDWEVWLERDVAARSDPPRRHSEGNGDGKRRALDHASDSTTGRDRSGSEQRLRRNHLQERPVVHSHAGEFPGRGSVPRRHPQIHRAPQILQHDHGRSLERARRSFQPAGGGNRGQLDRATRLSHRDGGARRRTEKSNSRRNVSRSILRRARAALEESRSPTRWSVPGRPSVS